MKQDNIVEINDFELTQESFLKLKKMLKAGKVVRNPFAKFFDDGNTTTIITEQSINPLA